MDKPTSTYSFYFITDIIKSGIDDHNIIKIMYKCSHYSYKLGAAIRSYRGDASVSITAVFNRWILGNPSDYYPLTWEGLDRLLNAELGQVAEELK